MMMTRFRPMICLLSVIALTVWRRPELLVEPRFWAEEGKYYFAYAFNHGFWSGLLAEHFGYFSLVPNIATAFATLVPLEVAPLVSTYFAFFFQVAACSVVAFGTASFWDTLPKKLLTACGILLLSPGETWLTTICTQYWLCCATFFLLLEPTAALSPLRKWGGRSLLATAGLTGPTSCFLTPFFMVKAYRSKEREDLLHLAILTAAAVLQVVTLFSSLGNDPHLNARFGGNDFSLHRLVMLQFVSPFLGQNLLQKGPSALIDEWFFFKSSSMFGPSAASWPPVMEVLAGTLLVGYFLYLAWKGRTNRDRQLMFGAFLLVVTLSTVLSIRMASSPRYTFAPSVMLMVILVSEFWWPAGARRQRLVPLLLVGTFCTVKLVEFRSTVYYSPLLPKWREEVMIWRSDSAYRPQIWPQPQFRSTSWEIELHREP